MTDNVSEVPELTDVYCATQYGKLAKDIERRLMMGKRGTSQLEQKLIDSLEELALTERNCKYAIMALFSSSSLITRALEANAAYGSSAGLGKPSGNLAQLAINPGAQSTIAIRQSE